MTTYEYLQLLRHGNYTGILEWRDALLHYYSPQKSYLEADILIPLMAYELINNGFTLEDSRHIEMLNAKLNSPSMQFSNGMDYYSILFISAALQFQVFADKDLLSFYQTTEKLTLDNISSWMARDNGVLTEAQNSIALREKQISLMKKSAEYSEESKELSGSENKEMLQEPLFLENLSEEDGGKIFDVSNPLNKETKEIGAAQETQNLNESNLIDFYKNNCTEYKNALENLSNSNDSISLIRLGIINSLHHYLHNDPIEATHYSKIISGFITHIRALRPLDWEEDYLSKLMPLSIPEPKPIMQKFYEASKQALLFFVISLIDENPSEPRLNDSPKN